MNVDDCMAIVPSNAVQTPEDKPTVIFGVSTNNDFFVQENTFINGLVKVDNGIASLINCYVKHPEYCTGSVQSIINVRNGIVIIKDDCTVEGDIECRSGQVAIKESRIHGGIKNRHGNISLSNATLDFIENRSGFLELSKTIVSGNIKAGDGRVILNDSVVQGVLQIDANEITLGPGAYVNELKLNHVDHYAFSSSDVSVSVTGGEHATAMHCQSRASVSLKSCGLSMLNMTHAHAVNVGGPDGISYLGGHQIRIDGAQGVTISNAQGVAVHGRGANTASVKGTSAVHYGKGKNATQYVTLKPLATLNKLNFTANKCVLTLAADAHYYGEEMLGLEIRRLP